MFFMTSVPLLVNTLFGGCSWWLVLIRYEKKVLLTGWRLMAGADLK
jgi:hypothetical protein